MERGERPVPLDLTDRIMALVPLDGEPDSEEVQCAREVPTVGARPPEWP